MLITTRDPLGWDAQDIHVRVPSELTPEEGVALLLNSVPGSSRSVLGQIVERLGGHALALGQAAAHIRGNHLSPDTYLKSLRSRGIEIVSSQAGKKRPEGVRDERREKSVESAIGQLFELSVRKLEEAKEVWC